MSRLSTTTGAVHRSPETLRRVAEQLGFSPEWLAFGRGEPEPLAPKSQAAERYPHRSEAARIALDGGLDPAAVNAVVERDYEIERDPSILWWLHEIQRCALLRQSAGPDATANAVRNEQSKPSSKK
jgi:hypothetical protein